MPRKLRKKREVFWKTSHSVFKHRQRTGPPEAILKYDKEDGGDV
jgi:hypothetical protein